MILVQMHVDGIAACLNKAPWWNCQFRMCRYVIHAYTTRDLGALNTLCHLASIPNPLSSTPSISFAASVSHLDGEEVLPVPGGDVGEVTEPHLVPQRHGEVVAAAVEAGAHVGGRVHGHALGHGVLRVPDFRPPR